MAVGLGTDGAATNNDLELWEEMRLAAGGAEAIGLADQIGTLAAGKRADLIQVSLEDLHFTLLYDLISHLVYVADEQDVVSVVVDGKVLMRDHKVLTVDIARVRSEANALADRIRTTIVEKGAAGWSQ